MNVDILCEKPMRGSLFENLAKIVVRRIQKNNFIFVTRQFDSLEQIMKRYRLKEKPNLKEVLKFVEDNFHRSDLIEFKLDVNREIQEIIAYDVKTKYHTIKRKKFEFTKKCFDFFVKLQDEYNGKVKVVSILLFKIWSCDLEIYEFDRNRCRVSERPPIKRDRGSKLLEEG